MTTTAQGPARLAALIADATKAAGNASRLAEFLEDTKHNVSAWKHGKRTCPLEAQILMASLTKRNIDEVIKEALLERNAGTPRGEKLVSALGKVGLLAGAVTASTLCGPDALASNLPGLLRCILC